MEDMLHGTTTLELHESVSIAAKECWSSEITCYSTRDTQNMIFATNIKYPQNRAHNVECEKFFRGFNTLFNTLPTPMSHLERTGTQEEDVTQW